MEADPTRGGGTARPRTSIRRRETGDLRPLVFRVMTAIDMSLQTKLLRVLQEGTFERVGGNQPISCRARISQLRTNPYGPVKAPPEGLTLLPIRAHAIEPASHGVIDGPAMPLGGASPLVSA